MKKLLLTTAAAAMLVTSSAYAAEGDFYVKANSGWTKLNNITSNDVTANNNTAKLKSQNSGYVGVGAGYHIMDNVRVDLTYDHFFNPDYKMSQDYLIHGQNIATNFKIKGKIDTLLLNAFVDVYDIDAFKIFVGAGVGGSNIKAKMKVEVKNTDADRKVDLHYKAKAKKTVAYAVYLGASYEFAPCVTGELTYSYRDMGKTKNMHETHLPEGQESKVIDNSSIHYKGHNIGAGIRFAL
ncbi:MAG: outer membrane protein [Rickettsiaceae bacterium]